MVKSINIIIDIVMIIWILAIAYSVYNGAVATAGDFVIPVIGWIIILTEDLFK